MFVLYTVLTTRLLPYFSFIFDGCIAWIHQLDWSYIKTIGIYFSFPQPLATKALAVPLVVAFFNEQTVFG